MKTEGQRLSDFRKERKLSLAEIANLTSVSVSTVLNYERGKTFMSNKFKEILNELFGLNFDITKANRRNSKKAVVVEGTTTTSSKSSVVSSTSTFSTKKKRGRFPSKKILQGLGVSIKSHREQSGLSANDYAIKFKTTKSYLADVESGKREVKTIPVNYLAKLVYDGVDINTFFSGI